MDKAYYKSPIGIIEVIGDGESITEIHFCDCEISETSEIYKIKNSNEIDTYELDIKNTSRKQLGNITVKIGQLDKDGKYIMIDNISSYNILKPSENIKMEIKALDNTKSIELLGYSYDDVKEKANINIDLKLHKASISG